MEWKRLDRITLDPGVIGGKSCVRGMRVTVGIIVGMIASGHVQAEVLALYPYLEPEDIAQALSYAAWRAAETEVVLGSA
jgi:uncharacterized protein (DUF433 family)